MSTRVTFDRELRALQQDILRMGSLVEQAVYKAVEALVKRDPVLAKEVMTGDDAIDALRLAIENRCVRLIATQQPIARDLRTLVTGIKIILNLERMGDHAVDIARAAMCVCKHLPPEPMETIPRMARLVQQMLKDGLDAYVYDDINKARAMCLTDDEVDELFNHTFSALVEYMENNPHTVACVAYLLMIARYLERIADRATNIGEDVIYLVTGEWQELN
ncbi:MAG: Phosphate-specific transport system accessory protein PhoU [Clostridia bacterium 62_21]|nr:MAG: Phosphate-specific transport system accessory protein PhoU [Clostridia bacterium 62_21]HAG06948.1 phosphate transport system regulatory protein PhoU [Peptococcaceae bacterium]